LRKIQKEESQHRLFLITIVVLLILLVTLKAGGVILSPFWGVLLFWVFVLLAVLSPSIIQWLWSLVCRFVGGD
jgi:hypothetical protein